jgi:hypothetical protein
MREFLLKSVLMCLFVASVVFNGECNTLNKLQVPKIEVQVNGECDQLNELKIFKIEQQTVFSVFHYKTRIKCRIESFRCHWIRWYEIFI